MEKLCRDVLTDPVRILVGELGEANTDITQIVEVIDTEDKKWQWLSTRLVEFTSSTYVCTACTHVYVLCCTVCVYCVFACVRIVLYCMCVLHVCMCTYCVVLYLCTVCTHVYVLCCNVCVYCM